MKTYRHESFACPSCKRSLNASQGWKSPPTAGDLTVCLHCSAMCAYKKGGTLRLLTQQDLDDLDDDTRRLLLRAHGHVTLVLTDARVGAKT